LCNNYQGEEYKLFWPEQSEFVRMAARFGAKIIPFGGVGEDDLGQVSFSIYSSNCFPLQSNYFSLNTGIEGELLPLPSFIGKYNPTRFSYLVTFIMNEHDTFILVHH
jgi:hypothetical protein